MDVLWTSEDAALATGGANTCMWSAHGVSIDTRQLQAGDLFVALKDQRDGHEFVAQALARGAAAALVTHRPEGVDEDAPLLVVPDVLGALENLARFARKRSQAKIAAVTGSNGKTSTKDMLLHMLSKQGLTHAAQASYNNHWGVPLTLARLPQEAQFCVVEIGMNAPGEIAPLSKLACPHVAMITMVGAAHMAAFESVEKIAHEKAAIIDGLFEGGVAVLNQETQARGVLFDKAKNSDFSMKSFGGEGADWCMNDVRTQVSSTVVDVVHKGESYFVCLQTLGVHFASNAVGALAVVDALGADVGAGARDLRSWVPVAGRGQRLEVCLDPAQDGASLVLLDDSFNANPASMSAALDVLARVPHSNEIEGGSKAVKGRKIAILGDMLELGEAQKRLHADFSEHEAMGQIDQVYCVGPLMKHLWDQLPQWQKGQWAPEAKELAGTVCQSLGVGDIVLVKGSKGSRVSLIADAILRLDCKEA